MAMSPPFFAILAINFLAIFAIIAKMANMAEKKLSPFLAILIIFFPKIDGEMAMSPPPIFSNTVITQNFFISITILPNKIPGLQ